MNDGEQVSGAGRHPGRLKGRGVKNRVEKIFSARYFIVGVNSTSPGKALQGKTCLSDKRFKLRKSSEQNDAKSVVQKCAT